MAAVVYGNEEFCVVCGSILPLPRTAPSVITCKRCSTKWSVPVRRNELIAEHVKRYHKAATDADDDEPPEDGSIVEHVCTKCDYGHATFSTRQTRSADEGQTVYYTCLKCKWRDVEFS